MGRLRRHIVENDPAQTSLAVIQDPLEADTDRGYAADPSHALIHPVPDADDPAAELIGDLIAQCVLDSFPAVRA